MSTFSKHLSAAFLFLIGQGVAGCLAAPEDLDETSDLSEISDSSGSEAVASAGQAITASQRTGIGKIYETGSAMGFAEFFASLINWSAPAPSMDVDLVNLNGSIIIAIDKRAGTSQAISSASYSPPLPNTLSKGNPAQPYALVAGWRSGIRASIAGSSSHASYYDLGGFLAIAEGQAYVAATVPAVAAQSWQYAGWALDSALASANALQGRVKLDINALSTLRNDVWNIRPSNAPTRIKTLRQQYASAVYAGAEVICGDNVCDGGETCSSCATDCGSCPVIVCGTGTCDPGETCSSCAWDCGSTYQLCQYCPNGAGYSAWPSTKKACSAQEAVNSVQATTSCIVQLGAC